MITVDMSVETLNWEKEEILYDIAKKALMAIVQHLLLDDVTSELSLLFTDDDHMARINAQWRNKNKPTNVLSFPILPLKAGQKPGPMLGDIVVARETLIREANKAGKSFHDHLTHMIIHGILHLLGYDHKTHEDAYEMEKLEIEILQKLSIKNPYADISRECN